MTLPAPGGGVSTVGWAGLGPPRPAPAPDVWMLPPQVLSLHPPNTFWGAYPHQ